MGFESPELPQSVGPSHNHVPIVTKFLKNHPIADETPIENPGRLLRDEGGRMCNFLDP